MFPLADHNPTRHIRAPWVNWALIAVCIAVFVLRVPWPDYAFTPASLHLTGAKGGGAAGAPGQMVSHIFLHASLLHLAGNMIALWVFGDNIEDAMGHLRYPLFFILCGMGGAGAEALFSDAPQVPVIGASGAIAGVMGAYLLLHPRARVLVLVAFRIPVLVPAGVFVGLSIALDLIAALAGGQGEVRIAFWAHIGGFATGAALIPLFRWRDVPLFQPPVPHPEKGFWFRTPLMPDIGRWSQGGGPAWFWIKAVTFFIVIALLTETFLA